MPLNNILYQMCFMGLIYLAGVIFTGIFSEITGFKKLNPKH